MSEVFFVDAPPTGKVVDACTLSRRVLLVEFSNGVLREYKYDGNEVSAADLIGVDCFEVASTIANLEHAAYQKRMQRRVFFSPSWSPAMGGRSCVCDAFGPCSVHAGRGR